MGQKVNPISMRLQVTKDWRSKWFAASKRDFANALAQDLKVRKYIEGKFAGRATIAQIDIDRSPNMVTVTIHTAKAGVVIGRGGAGAQELRREIEKIMKTTVRVNIEEVKRPELSAKLVGEFAKAYRLPYSTTMQAARRLCENHLAERIVQRTLCLAGFTELGKTVALLLPELSDEIADEFERDLNSMDQPPRAYTLWQGMPLILLVDGHCKR